MFCFSLQLVSQTFLILGIIWLDIVINVHRSHVKYPLFFLLFFFYLFSSNLFYLLLLFAVDGWATEIGSNYKQEQEITSISRSVCLSRCYNVTVSQKLVATSR
jgi:hypothetical protein